MADDGGSLGHAAARARHAAAGRRPQLPRRAGGPGRRRSRALFQYRFPHGEGLAGHALGNLDHRRARRHRRAVSRGASRRRARLLGARGRVLPSTLADVVLARRRPRRAAASPGQAAVAASAGPLARVHLEPASPAGVPARARGDRGGRRHRGRPGQPVHQPHAELPRRGRRRRAARARARRASTCATSRTSAARRRAWTPPTTCARSLDHGLAARSTSCSCTTPVARPACAMMRRRRAGRARTRRSVARIEALGVARRRRATSPTPTTRVRHDRARRSAARSRRWS